MEFRKKLTVLRVYQEDKLLAVADVLWAD